MSVPRAAPQSTPLLVCGSGGSNDGSGYVLMTMTVSPGALARAHSLVRARTSRQTAHQLQQARRPASPPAPSHSSRGSQLPCPLPRPRTPCFCARPAHALPRPRQDGKVPLTDLHVTDSSEAILSGRKPPFRLLVRPILPVGGPKLNIRHAVSEGFVVRRPRGLSEKKKEERKKEETPKPRTLA